MALSSRKLLTKSFINKYKRNLYKISLYHESEGGSGPYRPSPFEFYTHPKSAEYWSKNGYKPQSEKDDEYEKEEIYLDEIESRMRNYDKKYSKPERVKSLYNEFGFEEADDRAYYTYGGGLTTEENELQYGRGNKINPSHYINGDYVTVKRKSIPPVQFLTKEQVRRNRGSLAMLREVPPETPSIFKYWNAYTCVGLTFVLFTTKEWFTTFSHDYVDGMLLWTIIGGLGAVIADNIAWLHTIGYQEHYDRQWFMYTQRINDINNKLEELKNKPNERKLLTQLMLYREKLSEKVLQKTLSNRVQRIIDDTLKKLETKIQEENGIKTNAEVSWKKDALEKTELYFNNDNVKNTFTNDAIQEFISGDKAKLDPSKILVQFETNIFKEQYQQNLQNAQDEYIKEQSSKGTLNWVFKSDSERESEYKSKSEKEREYETKINEWESTRNSVNAPMPAFS